jgi:hypothetical protein
MDREGIGQPDGMMDGFSVFEDESSGLRYSAPIGCDISRLGVGDAVALFSHGNLLGNGGFLHWLPRGYRGGYARMWE